MKVACVDIHGSLIVLVMSGHDVALVDISKVCVVEMPPEIKLELPAQSEAGAKAILASHHTDHKRLMEEYNNRQAAQVKFARKNIYKPQPRR